MVDNPQPNLVSPDYKIIIDETNCCGVKDLHGIHNYRDGMLLLRHMLSLYLDAPTPEETESLRQHYVKTHPGETPNRYDYYLQDTLKRVQVRPAHIVYNSVRGWSIGDILLLRIEEFKLGDVIKTEHARNHNSGNDVRTYVWTPDWIACAAFWKKHSYRRCTCRYGSKDFPPAPTPAPAEAARAMDVPTVATLDRILLKRAV